MRKNTFFRTITLVGSFFIFLVQINAQVAEKADKQFELNQFDDAIKSYLKIIEKQPNNMDALSKLADAYRKTAMLKEAADWYAKLSDLQNTPTAHTLNYGKTLMELGDYDKARKVFKNYAQIAPEEAKHYMESCDFAESNQKQPSIYKVRAIPAINTSKEEFGGVIIEDNLVFSSNRTDMKRSMSKKGQNWDGEAFNQLFKSKINENGELQKPAFFQTDLKNGYNEGPISIPQNKKYVAITKNNFTGTSRQMMSVGLQMSLYIAEVSADGQWQEMKAFPYNNNGYSVGMGTFSDDGNVIYFASNKQGGFGGYDIYFSQRVGDSWSEPTNLGPMVNTNGNEVTPFLSGKNLYFSSDFIRGYGGYDVFRTENNNGVWDRVFHLGNGVNSSMDDYYFYFNEEKNMGVVTSNRSGGKGGEDIYEVNNVTNQVVFEILDATTKKPIEGAILDFSACDENNFETDKNGKYKLQALEGFKCSVNIKKTGYENKIVKIDDDILRKNQILSIPLSKAFNGVKGKVVDETNKVLDDVIVQATNQKNGTKLEAVTLDDGTYALPLQAKSTYVIRYTKAGYVDFIKNVTTGDKEVDGNILGMTTIKSIEASLAVKEKEAKEEKETKAVTAAPPPPPTVIPISLEKSAATTTTTKEKEEVEKTTRSASKSSSKEKESKVKTEPNKPSPKDVEKAKVEIAEKNSDKVTKTVETEKIEPKETNKTKVQVGTKTVTTTLNGYAVQIAAISGSGSIESYNSLQSFGNVYVVKDGNMARVRIGVFPDKAAAEAALRQIKTSGYPKAFIVEDSMTTTEVATTTPPPSQPSNPTESKTKTATPKTEPKATTSIEKTKASTAKSAYKVRLGAYAQPDKYFDGKKVETLGVIEEEKKGSFSVMYISGFGNLELAKKALELAKKQGFKEAYVVDADMKKIN